MHAKTASPAVCDNGERDQRARIVADYRPRHAAEVRQGRGDPAAPIVLPLIEKRFDERPARVAQDGDEQEDPHPRNSACHGG
jgi:hypothetical protein